jgi:hypothetical protein
VKKVAQEEQDESDEPDEQEKLEFRKKIASEAVKLEKARLYRIAHPVAPFCNFGPDCKIRVEKRSGM